MLTPVRGRDVRSERLVEAREGLEDVRIRCPPGGLPRRRPVPLTLGQAPGVLVHVRELDENGVVHAAKAAGYEGRTNTPAPLAARTGNGFSSKLADGAKGRDGRVWRALR